MPCDTVTSQTVDMRRALPDLVESALKAMGAEVQHVGQHVLAVHQDGWRASWAKGGEMTITRRYGDLSEVVREIPRQYSRAAVTWAAKRAGWAVSTANGQQYSMTVRKG
jgi:hypothetical protein